MRYSSNAMSNCRAHNAGHMGYVLHYGLVCAAFVHTVLHTYVNLYLEFYIPSLQLILYCGDYATGDSDY